MMLGHPAESISQQQAIAKGGNVEKTLCNHKSNIEKKICGWEEGKDYEG